MAPDFIFAVKDPLAATLAGLDVPALGGPGGRTAAMFTSGQVPPARLDDIVRRTLFAMFDSGAFDDPLGPAAANVSTPEHQALATKVSAGGMVLLKNDRHALPLGGHGLRSIAVIGPSGDDAVYISGGSSAVTPAPGATVTPLAGIRARAGSGGERHRGAGLAGRRAAHDDRARRRRRVRGDVLEQRRLLRHARADADRPDRRPGRGARRASGRCGRRAGRARSRRRESGLYRFSLLQAGLATLWVDGRRVGPGYREGVQFLAGPRYPMQAAVRLTAGKPVSIRVDYSSSAQLFGAQVHLAWQPPSASGIPAAVEAARHADAAIVLANNGQGEGMDRTTLALPGDQDQLIDAVAAVNRRTIVVLNTGGPVLMPWLHHVEAVLQAWYPGQQFGAALASVLFGDSDPGRPAAGHLPGRATRRGRRRRRGPSATRASTASSATTRASSSATAGTTSSASSRCSRSATACPTPTSASATCACASDHGGVTATTRVTNTSRRAGSTVAQAYLSFPRSAGEPPRQLKGYEKVALGAGPAARSSPSGSTAPTWPTSTRARTGRSSPTAATRCRWGARRATSPRAQSFELGRHGHR